MKSISHSSQVIAFLALASLVTSCGLAGLTKSLVQASLSGPGSQAPAAKVVLSQAAFQNTLYPYVKSVGCAQCHANGPTVAADWFAAPSLDTSFRSARSLVDPANPKASLLAVRVGDGHCGFSSICGIDKTEMVSAIELWVAQSANTPAAVSARPCSFNGQTLVSGTGVTAYSAAAVPFGQSCDSVQVMVGCSDGTLSPATAFASCAPEPGASCSFNGQTLASGSSVAAYQSATVPYGQTCAEQERVCANGTLSGSFSSASCMVSPAAACSFNGMTIPSGGSAQGYPAATVPYGQTCTAQPISCANGMLSPAGDVASCAVLPPASCTFNGQTIASGGTVKAYQAATVASGESCVSQTRTCTNGTLDGSYAFASCMVAMGTTAPASCTFNGATIASGATVQGYPAATVPYGQTCTAQTVTCTNGQLSPATDVASCQVLPAASCSFNGQMVASGAAVTAYQAGTVPYGNSCVSQVRTCSNGTLDGTYAFSSCSVNPPAACSFNGQSVASGGTVQGYPAATVPYGQTCQASTVTCTNGVLSPANAVASCTVQPGAACSFNGMSLASGQSTTGYASSSVPAGSSCSQIAVSCANGVLSPATASSACAVSASSGGGGGGGGGTTGSTPGAGSVFVPTNQAVLLRLNVGLNLPGKKTFVCQTATNCSAVWTNSGQYNVNFKPDPNQSGGANQVSLLAFAGCNDINPADWGVNVSGTVAAQTANLIAAGIQMIDNHTGGLGSNAAFKPQIAAAFQALISDPAYASASVNADFVGICTAAQTFGVGMKGF